MIIGTAGHIDHGKTALIKALTGVDADRLPEEKARGITIDLGYAYVPLVPGEIAGFVDVPGHEGLVHNMLAGATGIDFVLLVVAADDGPMPQTVEHLEILELLGIERGAVAITKIDAVDDARLERVRGEISQLTAGIGLASAPVFCVSNVTGEGIPALRAYLAEQSALSARRGADGRFRLAVDRCFTLTGAGTIVTGTVHSGAVRVGDSVMVSPSGIAVRVRGIHAQDRPAESGRAGQRCALNLSAPGFDRSRVGRGDWILDPSAHAPTARLDARVRVLAREGKPLRHWTPVHLHLGTSDVLARVATLEGDAIEPGGSGLVQLVIDTPVGALHGDRFVLRDQSSRRNLGGGVVLDPFAPQRGRRAQSRLYLLRAFDREDPASALQTALQHSPFGVNLSRFACAWNLTEQDMQDLAERTAMRKAGDAESALGFSAEHWAALKLQALARLREEHVRSPDMLGVGRERLRRLTAPALAQAAFDALVDELLAEAAIARNGPWLHAPDHRVTLTLNEQKLWAKILPLLEADAFNPPRVRDLAAALLVEEDAVRKLLRHVARLGEIYPVAHDHYFTARAVSGLAEIASSLADAAGAVEAAAFRDRIGTGRKIAIQILEFFDRVGYTRRVKDQHRLRQERLFRGDAVAGSDQ
ncbi:MAG TPA: selenocysteine-specific translation elongation factor [Burkholderiales bacterium]|nr:selenocysteine-specific translation elongation factor [Burkholderiales bacterium]